MGAFIAGGVWLHRGVGCAAWLLSDGGGVERDEDEEEDSVV